ncbi:uncharacterized protein LY89DRAFT_404377 [Mollisia scopiformis]|uniref:Uncharacterized protein n=1 Tax=Mollisia scopiformis TaxID=149040 RepID=A0A132B2S4_MOLSC|nr:uncharacterized protein LY89DRAFT_404377 [Mollisia scopiformis]KUJ06708.1 hypothetical protein LY89DRAFT_404377 [Mollisia scopiformis]
MPRLSGEEGAFYGRDGDGDGEKSVRLNVWSKTGPGSTAWRGRHSDMQMNDMRRIADAEGKCWTRFGRFERRVTVHDMMLIRLSLTRLEWFLARSRPSEDNDCTVTRHYITVHSPVQHSRVLFLSDQSSGWKRPESGLNRRSITQQTSRIPEVKEQQTSRCKTVAKSKREPRFSLVRGFLSFFLG